VLYTECDTHLLLKGIRPVINWVVWCWRGYVSWSWCRFAYDPADATATQYLMLQ